MAPGDAATLSLQEAADRLGVHYMTAYRYVRLGRLAGQHADGRWTVRVRDVDAFLRTAAQSTRRSRRGKPEWAQYRNRIRARLLAGDDIAAWTIVEQALAAGAEPGQVYVDVLAPVLRDIGLRWERGRLTVDDEHRVTAAARRVIGRLSANFVRRGRSRGTVLLGSAPADHHELPVTMLADMLRGAGFTVIDLGANVPVDGFLHVVAETACIAVGISAATDAAVDEAEAVVRALHAANPTLPVFVGGPAVPNRALATNIGADGWAADARQAVALFESTTPPRPASTGRE
jgi:excisionase family DNA binding protein